MQGQAPEQATPVRYEYSTWNGKGVNDIEGVSNKKAADGWELVEAFAAQDRYVCIFRRVKK